MNTLKLTAERPFTYNGKTYNGVLLHYRRCIHPKSEMPKTYKKVTSFICKERGTYESGCVSIYKTRRGFAASLYKDGCFYPYYATRTFICTLIEKNKNK